LPTAEDVIVQKLRWAKLGRREKDMMDTVGILRVRHGRLDWDYIGRWCADLDILDALAEARTRAEI